MSSPLFVRSRAIRHAEVEDCLVILDLNSQSYRVIDQVGRRMWSILTGEVARDAALADLCERYEVAPSRLAADLSAFAARCVEERLLVPANDTHAGPDVEAVAAGGRRGLLLPGLVGALRALVATQRALSREGFRSTYERYALIPVARDRHASPARSLRAFVRAENFYVAGRAPDDCLVRSLALYRFLRESGNPAVHVIAVRRFPFQAHAWVECAGESLLDGRRAGFTPLARIGDPHAPDTHTR